MVVVVVVIELLLLLCGDTDNVKSGKGFDVAEEST